MSNIKKGKIQKLTYSLCYVQNIVSDSRHVRR